MAKTTFAKLNLIKQNDCKEIQINELPIKIKQYLSFQDKTALMSRVINYINNDDNFYNPCKVQFFFLLEVVYAYTDIVFTEKQKEDAIKIYDLFEENHIFELILNNIPHSEKRFLIEGIKETLDGIYAYKNSAMGILDAISNDYSNLDLDASKIQKKLGDKDNLELLKNVMTKLG